MMARQHAKTPPYIKLCSHLSSCGEALLDQQMWCWGCDVRRANENLLLAYGCLKRPSPVPHLRSAYMYWLDETCALTLWGWGVWIASESLGSLFISRSRFKVQAIASAYLLPQAWCEADLPLKQEPVTLDHYAPLLATALTWIACYEEWVTTQTKPTYRDTLLESWPQRRHYRGGTPAAEMPSQWMTLAHRVRQEMLSA
jgi:hypothetical protein